MRTRMFACLVLAVFFLQGCMSTTMTAASTVYNRQGLKKTLNDQYITLQAYRKLDLDNKDKEFKNANVSVAVLNGEVLLVGEVPQRWQLSRAEELVSSIPDVKKVYNQLRLGAPSSALTRLSDTWLTAKVKGKMIASDDMDASQIKVVSENGTVYLMGTLLTKDANMAVDIARNTDGVTKVVKMFSYVTISKEG